MDNNELINPILANVFLHIAFDKWIEINHPEKLSDSYRIERYADDIKVHCKTEKQALFVLKMIQQRMTDCKLSLHPAKKKIVNLRGITEKKYPRSFDFLGFTIRPFWSKTSKGNKLMVSSFMSSIQNTSTGKV